MIRLLLFLIIPFTAQSETLSVEVWLAKYKRPCAGLNKGMVCQGRLDKALQRMKNSVVPKIFEESGLPLWLSTLGVVESDYNNDAVSSAGAIGVLQVMKHNVQTFYTKKTVTKGVRIYSGKLKFTETITETKPTLESCEWLAKDPKINARVSAWLLNKLYDKYKDWELVLQSYNAGEGRIDRYLDGDKKPLAFQTLNYFNQILAIQRYMEEKG